MEKKDITITCKDCHKDFSFTTGEQEFYEERGYTAPKACKDCRDAKKAQRNNSNYRNSYNEDRRAA